MGQLDRLEVVVAVKGLGEELGDVVLAEVEAGHDLEVAEGVVVHVLYAAVPEADDPQVEQPHAFEYVLVEVSDGVFVEDQGLEKELLRTLIFLSRKIIVQGIILSQILTYT